MLLHASTCLEQPGVVDAHAENNIQQVPDGLLPRSVIRHDSPLTALRLQSRRLAFSMRILTVLNAADARVRCGGTPDG